MIGFVNVFHPPLLEPLDEWWTLHVGMEEEQGSY